MNKNNNTNVAVAKKVKKTVTLSWSQALQVAAERRAKKAAKRDFWGSISGESLRWDQ